MLCEQRHYGTSAPFRLLRTYRKGGGETIEKHLEWLLCNFDAPGMSAYNSGMLREPKYILQEEAKR